MQIFNEADRSCGCCSFPSTPFLFNFLPLVASLSFIIHLRDPLQKRDRDRQIGLDLWKFARQWGLKKQHWLASVICNKLEWSLQHVNVPHLLNAILFFKKRSSFLLCCSARSNLKLLSCLIKTRVWTFLEINPLNDLMWWIVAASQAFVYFPFVSFVPSDWKQACSYSKAKGRTNGAHSQCEGWACFPGIEALIATSWKEKKVVFTVLLPMLWSCLVAPQAGDSKRDRQWASLLQAQIYYWQFCVKNPDLILEKIWRNHLKFHQALPLRLRLPGVAGIPC